MMKIPITWWSGKAVEAACWMAGPGGGREYPEQLKAGLKPANVREKYYHSRAPQGHNLVNRVVDISSYIDHKVRANVANKGKGPAGDNGARLRQALAKQGKRLPLLGDDDDTANFQYVKHFIMDDFRALGHSSDWNTPRHSDTSDRNRTTVRRSANMSTNNAVPL